MFKSYENKWFNSKEFFMGILETMKHINVNFRT